VVGVIGCLVWAFALPLSSVRWVAAVLGIGIALYALRRVTAERRSGADPTSHGDSHTF
jgi:APA family basic amino acid/polyamine antiporter